MKCSLAITKKCLTHPPLFNKVTVDDIKRVANKYFTKGNRTVGILKSKYGGIIQ